MFVVRISIEASNGRTLEQHWGYLSEIRHDGFFNCTEEGTLTTLRDARRFWSFIGAIETLETLDPRYVEEVSIQKVSSGL